MFIVQLIQNKFVIMRTTNMITITVVPPFLWSKYFDLMEINKTKLYPTEAILQRHLQCYISDIREAVFCGIIE